LTISNVPEPLQGRSVSGQFGHSHAEWKFDFSAVLKELTLPFSYVH